MLRYFRYIYLYLCNLGVCDLPAATPPLLALAEAGGPRGVGVGVGGAGPAPRLGPAGLVTATPTQLTPAHRAAVVGAWDMMDRYIQFSLDNISTWHAGLQHLTSGGHISLSICRQKQNSLVEPHKTLVLPLTHCSLYLLQLLHLRGSPQQQRDVQAEGDDQP